MKILFTDLDGTLLNDEKQSPEVNSTAIQKTLQKDGKNGLLNERIVL